MNNRYPFEPGSGIELIDAERDIQLKKYSYQHDQEHSKGELAIAAACYAYAAAHQARFGNEAMSGTDAPKEWPFAASEWKPGETALITLAKAGAFITAEIDRIMFAKTASSQAAS